MSGRLLGESCSFGLPYALSAFDLITLYRKYQEYREQSGYEGYHTREQQYHRYPTENHGYPPQQQEQDNNQIIYTVLFTTIWKVCKLVN